MTQGSLSGFKGSAQALKDSGFRGSDIYIPFDGSELE